MADAKSQLEAVKANISQQEREAKAIAAVGRAVKTGEDPVLLGIGILKLVDSYNFV